MSTQYESQVHTIACRLGHVHVLGEVYTIACRVSHVRVLGGVLVSIARLSGWRIDGGGVLANIGSIVQRTIYGLVGDVGSAVGREVSDGKGFGVLADWLTSHGKGTAANIGSVVEADGKGLGNRVFRGLTILIGRSRGSLSTGTIGEESINQGLFFALVLRLALWGVLQTVLV